MNIILFHLSFKVLIVHILHIFYMYILYTDAQSVTFTANIKYVKKTIAPQLLLLQLSIVIMSLLRWCVIMTYIHTHKLNKQKPCYCMCTLISMYLCICTHVQLLLLLLFIIIIIIIYYYYYYYYYYYLLLLLLLLFIIGYTNNS